MSYLSIAIILELFNICGDILENISIVESSKMNPIYGVSFLGSSGCPPQDAKVGI